MTKEQLLADIRNKMTPASQLIALVERYFDEDQTIKGLDELHPYIVKSIPKAKQSIQYLRNNDNFK